MLLFTALLFCLLMVLTIAFFFFSLDQNTGDIRMASGTPRGRYQFKSKVVDSSWDRPVISDVTVEVREIHESMVRNSGSMRVTGEEETAKMSTKSISII
jgi:hypothetical protein